MPPPNPVFTNLRQFMQLYLATPGRALGSLYTWPLGASPLHDNRRFIPGGLLALGGAAVHPSLDPSAPAAGRARAPPPNGRPDEQPRPEVRRGGHAGHDGPREDGEEHRGGEGRRREEVYGCEGAGASSLFDVVNSRVMDGAVGSQGRSHGCLAERALGFDGGVREYEMQAQWRALSIASTKTFVSRK